MFVSTFTSPLLLFCIAIALCDARLNRMLSQKHGKLGEPFGHDSVLYSLPPDLWFEQKLDHFNVEDTRTWKQRYFVNSTWFKHGGPVFLMIGGEGEASPKWMVQGAWLDYAQHHNALAVQVEHRFYGKSRPLPDLSLSSLQYLSSEQALADLAHFITSMSASYQLPPHTNWIAFGGSYPGSLAAWLRYKYPHLVHGAMSASGPLRAVLDFPEYFKVATEALATVSPKCVKAVAEATSAISKMLKSTDDAKYLTEQFRLCKPLNISNTKDVASFVESLADNFAGVVQYNKDNRAGSKNVTIDTLCQIMMDETQKPVARYAAVNAFILKGTSEPCVDYAYDKMISDMRNESWDSSMSTGGRQWTYQTCAEFGFYQTSNQSCHIFGSEFPLDYFTDMCRDIYGPKFSRQLLDSNIDQTNTNYGALDLEVSRVVFVHGSIDPWHALGIYQTRSNQAPAIYINGTAHCANMYPPSPNDLPDLVKARHRINHLIGKWLKADYHRDN
uniref:Serine protease K12H4.7 n=1 Tax=Cacopsylla melanoneura TaxID=428564 RepID=A0A8D8UV26_9HEMI